MSHPALLRLAAIALVCCHLFLARGALSQQPRLVDVEPFDRLTLKENSENKNDESKRVLKLRPLEMKKRRPAKRGDEDDRVRVRLFDREEQQYEVAWKAIEKLELFEELVLQEVAGLVEQQKFDEAYEYYLFLEARDAQFPGVAEGFQNCLFAEAASWLEKSELDQALGLLNEVHRRNADYPELATVLGETVDAAIETRLAAGQYAAVRDLIKDLEKKFKEHPVVDRRKQQIIAQASEQLATARTAAKARKLREAYIAASKAVDWWPELEGAKTLLGQIQARYRVITVGVADLGELRTSSNGSGMADAWATRRQRRLLNYDLAEKVADGSGYRSALGTWAIDGAKLSFTIHANARWTGGEPVTAYDAARRLQLMADPTSPDWRPRRNTQVAEVRIPASNRLEIDLLGPRAAALSNLAVPPLPWRAATDEITQPGTGLYTLASRGEGEAVFQVDPEHFAYDAKSQASEIVERRYLVASAAVAALLAGDIVCVDRIAPWDIPLFSRHANLTVAAYARPTMHMLVPNRARPLAAQRAFRRGIARSLRNKPIIDDGLFEGDASPAADLVVPTPSRFPFDPRLALAELSAAQRESGGGDGPLSITLAHPASETARRSARAIQRQLQLAGLGPTVKLQELDTLPRSAVAGDWDLLYVEWTDFDEFLDPQRMLGNDGFCGAGSPWLDEALFRADSAETIAQLQQQQAALLQGVNDDVPLIPLFIVREQFAYRKTLTNVGSSPITLYQNIEAWQYEQK